MQAFRLTEEARADGFSGGTVNCSPLGHAFDVGKALFDGEGIIVTDDDIFAQVLHQYPALERLPDNEIPEDATPVEIPHVVGGVETTGPPVHQTSPFDLGTGEILAEHSDLVPITDDDAVAIGEAVSGSHQQPAPPDQASEVPEGQASSNLEDQQDQLGTSDDQFADE